MQTPLVHVRAGSRLIQSPSTPEVSHQSIPSLDKARQKCTEQAIAQCGTAMAAMAQNGAATRPGRLGVVEGKLAGLPLERGLVFLSSHMQALRFLMGWRPLQDVVLAP